jgi:hypothetical protein
LPHTSAGAIFGQFNRISAEAAGSAFMTPAQRQWVAIQVGGPHKSGQQSQLNGCGITIDDCPLGIIQLPEAIATVVGVTS